jgi:endonuclease/exonuclease/phosphatase family metal-dependent hydrolase
MTYNIRHGQGIDGRFSSARIASVIREAEPDAAALSEVWRFPGLFHQPKRLSKRTSMACRHTENHWWGPLSTGNTVLSRGPVLDWMDIPLEGVVEKRGCTVIETELHGRRLRIAATHLSLHRERREQQIAILAHKLPMDLPLIVGGDFNCGVTELEPLRAILNLIDSPPKTFPSMSPQRSIDHILWSDHFELERMWTVASPASDHLPLLAELAFR